MGLSISSKSKLEFRASYGGLHYIRYIAYVHCGGERSPIEFEGGDIVQRYQRGSESYDWAFVIACVEFPNLMMHSDCDGRYTKNGRIQPLTDWQLQGGNSVQLLRELERLKDTAESLRDKHRVDTYDMLLALVRDVVNNHDGRIEFH